MERNKELIEEFEILIVAWLKSDDENVTNLAYSLAKRTEKLPVLDVSVSNSQIEKLFPFEDENDATQLKTIERIAAYNSRQVNRREGAKRLLRLLHSR